MRWPSLASQLKKSNHQKINQGEIFKDIARELECDEDEAAFDDKLRKIADLKQKKHGDDSS